MAAANVEITLVVPAEIRAIGTATCRLFGWRLIALLLLWYPNFTMKAAWFGRYYRLKLELSLASAGCLHCFRNLNSRSSGERRSSASAPDVDDAPGQRWWWWCPTLFEIARRQLPCLQPWTRTHLRVSALHY